MQAQSKANEPEEMQVEEIEDTEVRDEATKENPKQKNIS